MPRIAGVDHQRAVNALEKAGFRFVRQGSHITMSDGVRLVQLPRQDPINSIMVGKIVRDAGLTVEQFRELP